MVMPKDIARSYPKRGLTADVGFKEKPLFCGDGSAFFDDDNATATLSTTPGSSFSYGLWMNVLDFVPNNQAVLIEIGASGSAGSQVTITLTSTGQVQIFNGSGFIGTTAANTVSLNTWHFIAVTVDGSSGGLKIYVDGVDVTGTHTATFNVTDKGMTVGAFAPSSAFHTKGNLANVFYCTEILTQDQVRQIMRFSSSAQFATITGMESFYPLSADFNDAIGSANLTNSGATLQDTTKPQLPRGLDLAQGGAQARFHTGRCVDFDGSTDLLDMGTGVDKNYTTRSDQTTFSFWLNPDTTSTTQWIYQNRAAIGGTDRKECNHQFLYFSNTIAFDGSGASIQAPASKTPVGAWSFVCAVADSTSGVSKLYINGELFTTTSVATSGANGNNFVIGARNNTPIQLFNGKLSNFKIFNVELTQAQVRELYHNPEMVIPTGVSASNLRRHYPLCAFNDTSGMGGRYEIDQGVEGVNGEYGGSPEMAFAQPVPCPQLGLTQSATRLHHPGASQGAAATITAPGTTVSLSAWIFWDQARTSYPIALGTVTSTTDSFNIRINSGGQVTLYQNAEYLSGFTITEGGWNHIVFATRSDSPYWRCWLNNSEASSPAVANITNITSTDCRLGMNSSSFGMGGIANDAAVWNTELGDSDVAALYNSGVQGMDVSTVQSGNLLGWWKFDDLSTFKDFSGNSANATVSGTFTAIQFPENASGSTLVGEFSMKRKGVSVLNCFDDPGDERVRTEIPSGAGLQPSLTNGHTVSCWYRNQKQNTTSANNGTMVLGGDDSGNNRFILEALNGNTFRGIYGAQTATGTATISDNEWHHYAMVLDVTTASPTVRLYLDGVAADTKSGSLSATFPEGKVVIGGLSTTTSRGQFDYGLKGPIACPRIYAFQLSENEIKQIYHADERLIKGLNNE